MPLDACMPPSEYACLDAWKMRPVLVDLARQYEQRRVRILERDDLLEEINHLVPEIVVYPWDYDRNYDCVVYQANPAYADPAYTVRFVP